MIQVFLNRHTFTKDVSLAELIVIDDKKQTFSCRILELPWKQNERRVSCVPAGTYKMVLEESPRFGQLLWELKGVPNRSECKFHVANFVRQLHGCFAPGDRFLDIDGDGIIDVARSRYTLNRFHNAMPQDEGAECQITIVNGYQFEEVHALVT